MSRLEMMPGSDNLQQIAKKYRTTAQSPVFFNINTKVY